MGGVVMLTRKEAAQQEGAMFAARVMAATIGDPHWCLLCRSLFTDHTHDREPPVAAPRVPSPERRDELFTVPANNQGGKGRGKGEAGRGRGKGDFVRGEGNHEVRGRGDRGKGKGKGAVKGAPPTPPAEPVPGTPRPAPVHLVMSQAQLITGLRQNGNYYCCVCRSNRGHPSYLWSSSKQSAQERWDQHKAEAVHKRNQGYLEENRPRIIENNDKARTEQEALTLGTANWGH